MKFKNKTINDLPRDSFINLSAWIEGLEIENLRNEYIMISKNLGDLTWNMELPMRLHENINTEHQYGSVESDTEDQSLESDSDDGRDNEMEKNKKISVVSIIQVLNNFSLEAAFPNITLAYKALGTIPPSSSSAERSFSKVKIEKNYNSVINNILIFNLGEINKNET